MKLLSRFVECLKNKLGNYKHRYKHHVSADNNSYRIENLRDIFRKNMKKIKNVFFFIRNMCTIST